MEERGGRVIGEYMLGPKIGSGSFAVVWHGRHRKTGLEVAVKEIDKKQLSPKVHDSLLKEITILRHVLHPNIVRLHHAIQTEDRIYLVLEYCGGGDLAAYIQRHGRVTEAVARHFMRQLASGLQVLRENNLIHRDLKPQNLLLSTNSESPDLKIGDFGFARYLMAQGLADTLCGSPLYMAPEIIQNKKYDAKADLWSVGVILYQLVTGKPPFDGSSQFQLFQNILTSSELHFPKDVLVDLHPDCVNLCRSLLRQNPVERLTFEDFFHHKFMAIQRPGEIVDSLPQTADDSVGKGPDCDPSSSANAHSLKTSSVDEKLLCTCSLKDSLDSIEQEYVLVHPHFASTETLPSSLDASLRYCSADKFSGYKLMGIHKGASGLAQKGEQDITSVCRAESMQSHMPAHSLLSYGSSATVPQETSSLHPSTRLQFLYHFVHAITEIVQEKFNAGLHLESFSVELVALAVWKEALKVCTCWMVSDKGKEISTSSANACTSERSDGLFLNLTHEVDFKNPSAACSWVQRGFISGYELAEEISHGFRNINGDIVMPDAMEIIFQSALLAGRSGAVDELMGNRSRAIASYSKATTLLMFILMEAMQLPLNPPFVLLPSDKQRIQGYVDNLRALLKHSLRAEPATGRTQNSAGR